MHLLKAVFVFTMRGQLMRMNYTLSGGLLLQKIKLSALAHQLGQKISQLFSLTLTNSPQLLPFLSILFFGLFLGFARVCLANVPSFNDGSFRCAKVFDKHIKNFYQNQTAHFYEDICSQIPF